MTVYSQGGEQEAIAAATAELETGKVLEIGAGHPTTFSNSRALIERGWNAVLVEASPDQFLTLYREYGRNQQIELILAAVGERWDLVRLHHTEDLVSTTEQRNYEKWRNHADFDGTFWVPTVPIEFLFNRGTSRFDVVSIDTEGTSGSLFRQMLRILGSSALPRVICVEHDGDMELETIAAALGYRRIYLDPNNLILAKV